MKIIIPKKLKVGDEVRVIAPSRSLSMISQKTIDFALGRFRSLGLKVSFGKHVSEADDFVSSSISSRVEDLHTAFSDRNVKAIITAIGGFNANQLLSYIDFDLIKKNQKLFCGYSDITVLQNAFFSKTGLVCYSGPHFSTFGMELGFEYTQEYFKKCLFSEKPFVVQSSPEWSDDAWYINQKDRTFQKNPGFKIWNSGQAQGTLVGGNLCTLNLIQGTEYMPSLKDSILFLEDDEFGGKDSAVEFDRNLQSLIHLPDFKHVQALLIGRFQKGSHLSDNLLEQIIKTKRELNNIPVISNLDFGHTSPYLTLPIGGTAKIEASKNSAKLTILDH